MSSTANLDFGANQLSMAIALSDLKRTDNQPEPDMFRGELCERESVGEGTPESNLELYYQAAYPPNDVLEVQFESNGSRQCCAGQLRLNVNIPRPPLSNYDHRPLPSRDFMPFR